jgi:hypothetical protein
MATDINRGLLLKAAGLVQLQSPELSLTRGGKIHKSFAWVVDDRIWRVKIEGIENLVKSDGLMRQDWRSWLGRCLWVVGSS